MSRLRLYLNRHTLYLLGIFLLGVLVFAVLILLDKRIPKTDDYVFPIQILPYDTVIDWVVYRYESWSGRVFSEALVYMFSPAPFIYWQVGEVIMYGLFSGMLFVYYRLFARDVSAVKDRCMMMAALVLPYLMHKSVLADGVFWMTGSMVYFWITTLGLIAFYPVLYWMIKQRGPHWSVSCIGVVLAVIAAMAEEQVGALLLGFSGVFLVYQLAVMRKNGLKTPWYILMYCVVVGLSLWISISAPGNTARLNAEVITWLPDFYTTPVIERVEYGYRWLLEAFVNHSGFLLIGSWLSMAALFAKKAAKRWFDYGFIAIFVLASIVALAKFPEMSLWVNFYASWKPDIPNILASMNLIAWGAVMVATVVAPPILYPKKMLGYILSLLFLASIASMALLLLSPTMYASLWRCFFVPSAVLLVILYILIDRIFDKFSQYKIVIVGIIVSLAIAQGIAQAIRMISIPG